MKIEQEYLPMPKYRDEKYMTAKRFYAYKREINRLAEIDKQISLKVQQQLNSMDAKDLEKEKKARERLLNRVNFTEVNYEIEKHKDEHYIELVIHNDKLEQCAILTLYGDRFERMEYGNKGFDPTEIYEKGIENIFCGDNEDYWEDSDIIEIFYNNLMEIGIRFEDY